MLKRLRSIVICCRKGNEEMDSCLEDLNRYLDLLSKKEVYKTDKTDSLKTL